ncbi:MAG: bis(5'-nucleosyl)-tetraphosphatase (symmetrical) YqeK [Oscillospiraceae bacterium]|nr:bis(5'-nucleosyl)-tetraphosphatase (symmetrical) YqeK [Oscillospiraceae bacterium]
MNIDSYVELAKSRLSLKRFMHSLSVSREAKKLAQKHGCDEIKAEIAGILHDIMKETSCEEQLAMIKEANIKLNEIERRSQKLWHAPAGAAYAKLRLKIIDKDILNAINYHTSGRANMSILEKVVFVADYISEDRKYNMLGKIKFLSSVSLDEAIVSGTEYTMKFLFKKKKLVDSQALETYNAALMRIQDKEK